MEWVLIVQIKVYHSYNLLNFLLGRQIADAHCQLIGTREDSVLVPRIQIVKPFEDYQAILVEAISKMCVLLLEGWAGLPEVVYSKRGISRCVLMNFM